MHSSADLRATQRRVRVVQILPIDGIGGVEAAARSALNPADTMEFGLAPMAGTLPSGSAAGLAPRYRSPDDPRAIADTVRRVLRFDPDVVVGSLWRSVTVLLAVKLLRPKTRIVYFLHVENVQHLPDRLLSTAGIALADAIWCDSAATRQARLNARQRKRSRVISLVIDRLAPGEQRPPVPRFTIWARLNYQKGVDHAIRLIAALVARGIDARYEVHGPDGGERRVLEAQTRAARLEQHVSFQGPLAPADRARVASDATFFLQLSRFEGMAMGIVEAMQLGLVPVVTAVGEVGRYVRDGVNGIVVDPDAVDAAAERLADLLRHPSRIASLRMAAIETWQRAHLYRDDIAAAARDLTEHTSP